ncbi:MAG TPA: PQQ-binding-like beta-propeller repeat protein [Mycobacteriales bacterium]
MRTRVVAGATVGTVAVVVVAALVTVVVPLVGSSDAVTTDSRTAARPVELAPGPLPASITRRWTAATSGAQPSTAPAAGGTVVVGGGDRVAGLDAGTGREIWSYTRDNARLCGWTLRDGVVVALFAKSHGCRQVVGLAAGTGARRWYRTLEIPGEAVLSSGPGVAVATTSTGQLAAMDTATGLNRWVHRGPAGCTLDPAVAGRVAVVAVAHCTDGSVKLVGHDTYADKSSWIVPLPAGSAPVVLGGDESAAVLVGTTLTTYDAKGKVLVSLTDPRLARAGSALPAAVPSGTTLVVWTGAAATAVDVRTRAVLWSAPAIAPPALDDDQIVLATGRTVTSVRVEGGAVAARTRVTGEPLPAGATLARVGALLVASARGAVAAYG